MDFKPHLSIPDIPEFEPTQYEDTFFKDMADDLKKSQDKTTEELNIFIEESKKTDSFNKKITIATFIVSILTLIATITGIVINLI